MAVRQTCAEEGPKDGRRTPESGSPEARARGGTVRKWLHVAGPGVITGASDDDPSGIATYAVAGASFGFATLWLSLFCLPFMASVQFISAKVGMVTGQGIAGTLKRRYPKAIVYPAVAGLVIVNTINAGADIGAIGAAVELFVPIPIEATVVPIAAGIVGLQIFASYAFISRTFKWLALALFAYLATAFFIHADVVTVLRHTFVPTLRADSRYLATVVAIMGTTISPYLWFWQSNQEVDEEISLGRRRLWQRKGASDRELRDRAIDVNAGMLFSNVVMYFIILVTAATLFKAGKTDIQTADDAAQALRPLAGDAAGYLLGVGLIGAGLLAVPVLTGSAAYCVGETFGWKSGLDEKPSRAKAFYGVMAASTLIGVLLNFSGINPIDALFYTAVLNGLLAPPLLVFLMLLSNDPEVMGSRTNSRTTNILGWAATCLMSGGTIVLLVLLATGRSV